ncbi:hypothetical protein [Mucilaginibacter antarcticus]|uniref:hypothetical protein n=1 Tax=Mucilaginibacter antarcticus TaxID=1855725 RepID=UPI003639FA68
MAETGFKKWIITITVITASLLELIDTTIVNVALPHMQGNLGATLEDVAWVVTGYAVANVIILPMSGWLGGVLVAKSTSWPLLSYLLLYRFCAVMPVIWMSSSFSEYCRA